MNAAYRRAIDTTIDPVHEELEELNQAPVEGDAVAIQARIDWVQSSGTQALVKALTNDSNILVADAIKLALVNHQQDNSKHIVQKLVEANCLRKVMEKYVSIK